MNSSMEKISSNKVKLRLELEAQAFEEAVQKAYLKMRGRITVPGFRKGKAPRAVIERMYGEGVFYEEALDIVFPDMYRAAVAENGLEVVDQPSVDVETMEKGKDLVVTAEVFVSPDVTLGTYKGLDVQRGSDTVEESEVSQEIERVRARNAREIDVTDRAVQDGDIVGLDYAGTVDGVAFEGGTAKDQTLTIG
ncbi:MAG TPA: trigger factor, partial [Candidatus Aphodomonas merdavium]|nr:trigger factor [Candidatus Aphodomonas merdavium]